MASRSWNGIPAGRGSTECFLPPVRSEQFRLRQYVPLRNPECCAMAAFAGHRQVDS